MRRIAFGEKHDIGICRAALGMHADHASVVTNQTLDGRLARQHDAVLPGDLGEVAVVDRPQDRVAGAEDVGRAQARAHQAVAVVKIGAALDESAFVRGLLDDIAPKGAGVLEVLGEVDGTRPVFGARVDPGLAHQNRKTGLAEGHRGRNTGGSGANDDDVEAIR